MGILKTKTLLRYIVQIMRCNFFYSVSLEKYNLKCVIFGVILLHFHRMRYKTIPVKKNKASLFYVLHIVRKNHFLIFSV